MRKWSTINGLKRIQTAKFKKEEALPNQPKQQENYNSELKEPSQGLNEQQKQRPQQVAQELKLPTVEKASEINQVTILPPGPLTPSVSIIYTQNQAKSFQEIENLGVESSNFPETPTEITKESSNINPIANSKALPLAR